MLRIACCLTAILLAAPAFASDGVLEINQACAVQTGCFSGDTAGFPVTMRIRNGSVTGMADLGVGTNATGLIEDLNSSSNAGTGIFVGPGSSVVRSQASGNGGDGIGGVSWVRVSATTAVVNGGNGVSVGDESEVSNGGFRERGRRHRSRSRLRCGFRQIPRQRKRRGARRLQLGGRG